MSVLEGDIKLLKSESLSDTDDGGGRMTGQEIVDGVSNNLFPDISELDRTIGRINLRKFFPAVLTPNTDSLYGAHVIIEDAPDDPAVSATLFSTKDWFDHRADARDRLESYLAIGGRWPGYLYETQIEGVAAVQIWQRLEAPLPEVGNVYVLIEHEGQPDEVVQYVRATKVSDAVQTFSNSSGVEYQRRIVTMEISDALRSTFHGPPVSSIDPVNPSAVIRQTVVADASRYYGVQPLSAPANSGAFWVQAASIFTQLVPSAQSEVPVVDLNANAENTTLIPSADGTVSFTTGMELGPGISLYLGTACVPGTLNIAGPATLTDVNGTVYSGGITPVGSINYAEGIVTFAANSPTYSGSKTVTFQPAGPLIAPTQTASIAVTLANRGLSYTITLPVPPKPATLKIAYRAQGKWYVLSDQGDGTCKGFDASFGAGTVKFDTGSVILTLGALPDVGSRIMFTWGVDSYTFNRGGTILDKAYFEITTENDLVPGGVTITWNDGDARSAGDDGIGGLTGNATGRVIYTENRIRIAPNVLPPVGTEFTVTITPRARARESFPSTERTNGLVSLTLANGNVIPGSVEVKSEGWEFPSPPAYTPLPTVPKPQPTSFFGRVWLP